MEDFIKFKSCVGIVCDVFCFGFQILGMLICCEFLMKFMNCLFVEVDENGEEFMQDIYGEVVCIVVELMCKV